MQTGNLPGGQELLCINTEKVYDWVINDATFDLTLNGLELPDNPATGDPLDCDDIDIDTVTCTVEPIASTILDRVDRDFVIDDSQVTLQLVNIRKTFEVTIFVDLVGGGTVEVATREFTRCEQVILCAPEGTDVNVTFTEVDCFVCTAACDSTTTPGELDVSVNVRLCQSIQSVFDVTLEVIADFCQPRDVLQIPPCPVPTIPPQCPVVFPSNRDNC
ncbi:hypothetical protein [Oceanobacillus rekensis]|uniref:hypothetical protein n=1 Tax=Oceanobacillus rekensis TaxID=937927 RepID=UPI000B440188|nr:hypothetical protein [Oceanobacillus rekensis]